MRVIDRYMTLRDSTVKFVCLEGYDQLLNPGKRGGIFFLTDNQEEVTKILCAQPKMRATTRRGSIQCEFSIMSDDGKPVRDIVIYQKGKNVFPERYESKLLHERIIYKDITYIPERQELMWSMLYRRLVHQGEFSGDAELHRVISDAIELRIGTPVKPSYNSLGFRRMRTVSSGK